jgi:CrcB protein
MHWPSLIYVFIGGGLGSMLRFVFSWFAQRCGMSTFPLATLVVNVLGCAVMGYLFAYFSAATKQQEIFKVLLMTGFCGGFTTFSSFALEQMNLLHHQQWVAAIGYFAGTNAICLLALGAGSWIYRLIAS